MSYTALYRKLRPKSFSSVIGQSHIVRTLKNQIVTGRISHAYLFCGTRGTGKTSTAKIFSKAINCLSTIDGEACGNCSACKAIDGGYSMNSIEIDAASNNGVENIRDIRDEIQYPPAEGKYKVYIIDEVHMLSIGAFNALLKTLEEPPEHVIFILATTDPQKIPATIHSRCQRFDFKRITTADMTNALLEYAKTENISIDQNAIQYISYLSDGAMRDALSILDQCVAFYYDEPITMEKVQEIVGTVDSRIFYALTDALHNSDSYQCLEIINDLIIKGRDVSQFVAEFVSHLRNLVVALSIGDSSLSLDILSDNIQRLREQGQRIDQNILLHYINSFSLLQNQIKYSSNERILLEVACLRICNPSVERAPENIEPRIQKLENFIASGNFTKVDLTEAPSKAAEKAVQAPAPIKKAMPEDIHALKKDWKNIVSCFPMPLRSFLQLSDIGYLEGDVPVIITTDVNCDYIRKDEAKIKEELKKHYDREFDISIISNILYNERHHKHYGAPDLDLDSELKRDFTDKGIVDIMYIT